MEWLNVDKYSDPRDDHCKIKWWFCLDDYEFYQEEHLKNEYGYKTSDEIEESGFYIPLFRFYVNISKLEEKFLEENYSSDKEVVKKKLYYDCFTPEGARWGEYYCQALLEAAEAWCKKYHIRYKK